MSTLKVNDIQEATQGGGKIWPSRAWVNFNGTGTVAIRADGNVSSITDLGTGKASITFSSTFSSANYAPTGAASKTDQNNDGNMHCQCNGYNNGTSNANTTSTTYVVTCYPSSAGAQDCGVVTHNTVL